jgi:uncharacterized delta-60 repeat protein
MGETSPREIWRVDADGSFDATFNGNGRLVRDGDAGTPDSTDEVLNLALTPSGDIVAVGRSGGKLCLWKLDARDGKLAPSFGKNGVRCLQGPESSAGHGILIDSRKRLVIAGKSNATGVDSLTIWRFDAAGSLDTSFANQGLFVHQSANLVPTVARRLALEPSGRLLVVGHLDSGDRRQVAVWAFYVRGL